MGQGWGSHSCTYPSQTWLLATTSNNCQGGLRELRDPYLFVWLVRDVLRAPHTALLVSSQNNGDRKRWTTHLQQPFPSDDLLCPTASSCFLDPSSGKADGCTVHLEYYYFPIAALSPCKYWLTSIRKKMFKIPKPLKFYSTDSVWPQNATDLPWCDNASPKHCFIFLPTAPFRSPSPCQMFLSVHLCLPALGGDPWGWSTCS